MSFQVGIGWRAGKKRGKQRWEELKGEGRKEMMEGKLGNNG